MGPFRTPAPMPRAPIPPHGHGEWHPRPELLNALDSADAFILEENLITARQERFSARGDALVAVWAFWILVALAWSGWPLRHPLVDLIGYAVLALSGVLNGRRAHAGYGRALQLRDRAYHEAERALEAKLNRDPRPHVLRLITNLDSVRDAIGMNDEMGGAA